MRLPNRLTATVAATALAASVSLVSAPAIAAPVDATADAANATPAAATFSSVTISGLKKKNKLPKPTKTRTVNFTVNIAGSPSDGGIDDINGDGLAIDYKTYDADFSSAKIVSVKSKIKSPTLPRLNTPLTVAPGANTYQVQLHSWVSPGIYELQIPITQNDWTGATRVSTTKVAKARFQVHATKKVSLSQTSYSAPGWNTGKTAKFTFRAPEYQKGAKVTLFYKAGKGKFKKITTKKLKVKKGTRTATAVLKTKKLRPGHKIHFKVSKTKWAPKYKTKNNKIVRR